MFGIEKYFEGKKSIQKLFVAQNVVECCIYFHAKFQIYSTFRFCVMLGHTDAQTSTEAYIETYVEYKYEMTKYTFLKI